MFLVGLTGSIGTGKSTVSNIFKKLGVIVIDADVIARDVVQPGRKAWRDIREQFGDDVLMKNGQVDREKLAKIIFNDQFKRTALNKITHYEIYKEMFRQCLWHLVKGKQFVVLDMPLLFESGYKIKFLNKIIVVKCNSEQQVHRLMERNKYSLEEAQSRINAQMSMEEKCRKADIVIDNSISLSDTKKQVERIVEQLEASHAHWKLRIAFWSIVLITSGTFSLPVCKMISIIGSHF